MFMESERGGSFSEMGTIRLLLGDTSSQPVAERITQIVQCIYTQNTKRQDKLWMTHCLRTILKNVNLVQLYNNIIIRFISDKASIYVYIKYN